MPKSPVSTPFLLICLLSTACTASVGGGGGTALLADVKGGTDATVGADTSFGADADSSTVDIGNPNGPSVQLADFTVQVTAAYCQMATPCCAGIGEIVNTSGCAQFTQLFTTITASVKAGKVAYSPTLAGSCLAAIQAMATSSECRLTASSQVAACQATFQGKLTADSACQSANECAAPAGGDSDCVNNKCLVFSQAGVGDACVRSCYRPDPNSRSCHWGGAISSGGSCDRENGVRCDLTAKKCVELTALGAPCSDTGDCVAGAVCIGVCKAIVPTGQACTTSPECGASGACQNGLCIQKVADGGACINEGDCASGLCNTGKCKPGQGDLLGMLCQ